MVYKAADFGVARRQEGVGEGISELPGPQSCSSNRPLVARHQNRLSACAGGRFFCARRCWGGLRASGAAENASRTTGWGFCAPRAYSVPQEAFSSTECHKHNAVTSCGADYRVINTLITDIRLITDIPSWKPPGTRNNRFAEKPLQLFQKIAGTFTQFFIFVPNKYRNTQCKLFTTNTTNSWNLPR